MSAVRLGQQRAIDTSPEELGHAGAQLSPLAHAAPKPGDTLVFHVPCLRGRLQQCLVSLCADEDVASPLPPKSHRSRLSSEPAT